MNNPLLTLVYDSDRNQVNLIDAAFMYADSNWRVFPIKEKSKAPPLIKQWQIRATDDKEKINIWWGKYPNANIGIATGIESGIFVVDIDPKNGGDESLTELLENKTLPETLTVKTGSGGRHLFFNCNTAIKSNVGKLGKGIDIRAEGGYVVAARSIHPNGNQYRWLNSKPIAEAPEWLINCLTKKLKVKKEPVKTDGFIPNGTRNKELYRRGCSLRGKGITARDLGAELHKINLYDCETPLADDEVNLVIASVNDYINRGKAPVFRYRDYIRSNQVIKDQTLRHILLDLSLYMDMNGNRCYPSQEQIADDTGLTRETVNKKLKIAEDKGYIKILKHKAANQEWGNNVYLLPKRFVR